MKYVIDLHRKESRTVEAFANTPAEAVKQIQASNPGFKVDTVTEMIDENEAGESFEVAEVCEMCDTPIFDGEPYHTDPDGICICESCASMDLTSPAQSAPQSPAVPPA